MRATQPRKPWYRRGDQVSPLSHPELTLGLRATLRSARSAKSARLLWSLFPWEISRRSAPVALALVAGLGLGDSAWAGDSDLALGIEATPESLVDNPGISATTIAPNPMANPGIPNPLLALETQNPVTTGTMDLGISAPDFSGASFSGENFSGESLSGKSLSGENSLVLDRFPGNQSPDGTPVGTLVGARVGTPEGTPVNLDRTLAQVAPPANTPSLDPSRVDPNRDRFPQPLPQPQPDTPAPEVLDRPSTPGESLPGPGSGVTVQVNRIEVLGSTLYSPEELATLTAPYEGKPLTLEDLQAVADSITQRYLNEGYITSRAILVDQEIVDGVVQIQVVEGTLGEITIEGTRRVSRQYIEDRIRLGAQTPLRVDKLEDQLRLLRVDPMLANLEATLRASEKVGESLLMVRVVEAPNWGGSLGTDNYSPESVGGQRTKSEIYYRNIMGNGETITGSWDRSYIGGSNVFRLGYRMPVNARNGTVQFQTTIDRNDITQVPFSVFDIAGNTERYDLNYRQPIIRNPRQELALSVGYTYQRSQTFVRNVGTRIGNTTGAETDGTTRSSIIKFGQDYVRRDASGAWAFQSQFSFGTNWLGATTQGGNIPDSQFFSWLSQGQRVQRVGNRQLLIIQGDLQFASGPMLGSQQFVVGGGQSVRGYRQNARAADSGWRFSVEDRITVRRNEAGRALLQLAPFFDAGMVWNHRRNPNGLSNDKRFLAGTGLGVIWQPLPTLNVRFDYGIPLVGIKDIGSDTFQSRGLYFTVGYTY